MSCYAQLSQSNVVDNNLTYEQVFQKSFQANKNNTILDDSIYTTLGKWDWGPCFCVTLKDSVALIGDGHLVQILSLSNVESPQIIGEYHSPSLIFDLIVRDSLAFILSANKLIILNISNLSNPSFVSSVNVTSAAAAIKLVCDGSSLYVISLIGLLKNIDISNPYSPILKSSAVIPEHVYSLATREGYVYLGYSVGVASSDGLDVFDASNPDSLKYVRNLPTGGFTLATYISDTLLFAAGRSVNDATCFLQIFNIADQNNPVQLSLDTIGSSSAEMPVAMKIDHGVAYITTNDSGIYTYDISNPMNPTLTGHLRRSNAPRGSADIDYFNKILAVASNSGLWLIRAPRADSLTSATFYITGSTSGDIMIKGNYAFLLESTAGVAILDILDSQNPKRISAVEIPRRTSLSGSGNAYRIACSGNYAYVTSGSSIDVIDINDIRSPVIVNYLPIIYPGSIVAKGNRLYVAQEDSGFTIFDISNPPNLFKLSSFPLPHGMSTITVEDSILIASNLTDGLSFIDISKELQPMKILTVPGDGAGVVVKDKFVYATLLTDSTDFSIYSITNPLSPALVSKIKIGFSNISYVDMDISSYIIYCGAYAIDVTNPATPILRGGSSANDYVAAAGSYLYYSDGSGLQVLRNKLITSVTNEDLVSKNFELYQNYPNPFNSQTTINYTLSTGGSVELKVYDILGREVITMVTEEKAPGRYELVFDASSIPSGVYFYKIQAGKFSEVRKMLLMK